MKANQVIKELGLVINNISVDRLIELIKDEWDKNPDSEIKNKARNNLTLKDWSAILIKRKISSNEPATSKWLAGGTKAIIKFNADKDILLCEITVTFLKNFEAHHLSLGNSKNTISIYLRAIRSMYNSAIEEDCFIPLKNVFHYYKIPATMRTKKRAISKEEILRIVELKYNKTDALWNARNYALIMFYCRGMNFKDLVQLKADNIQDNRLYYGRSKTGTSFSVKIGEELAPILAYYTTNKKKKDYLFPTNYDGSSKYYQKYKSQRRRMNERLRIIAKDARIDATLTTYTIRHSWATIAKYLGISTALISEGLGHSSIKTTEIYLKDFHNEALDQMNELVISNN